VRELPYLQQRLFELQTRIANNQSMIGVREYKDDSESIQVVRRLQQSSADARAEADEIRYVLSLNEAVRLRNDWSRKQYIFFSLLIALPTILSILALMRL
jgi:hydrogenase maturation factor